MFARGLGRSGPGPSAERPLWGLGIVPPTWGSCHQRKRGSPGCVRVLVRRYIGKAILEDVSLARRLRQGERVESKSTGKRRRRLKAVLSVAAALMMLATAPGLAAQEAPGGFPAGAAPGVGFDPAQGPAGGAAGVCTHAPGEFLVGYASEEAFRAAPTGNVVGTFPEILAQHLALPEVAGDPAAEEAKRQELSAQPGVLYAEYNCAAQANQAAAPEAAPAPPPAICANCGKRVVEKVGKILDGGSGGSDAYGAALDAARATDGSVALASETEPGEEDPGSAGSAGGAGGDNDTGSSPEESSESEAGPADAGEGHEEGSTSSETEAEPGENSAGVDTEPVSQRNVPSSGLRETASSTSALVLGAGALLLAAGLFVARRTLGR